MTRTFANLRETRRTGEDKFGKFRITGGPCTNCGATHIMCINYRFQAGGAAVTLPAGIKPGDTILIPANSNFFVDDAYLGINCGCYAKLHRQVAHIEDNMKARTK